MCEHLLHFSLTLFSVTDFSLLSCGWQHSLLWLRTLNAYFQALYSLRAAHRVTETTKSRGQIWKYVKLLVLMNDFLWLLFSLALACILVSAKCAAACKEQEIAAEDMDYISLSSFKSVFADTDKSFISEFRTWSNINFIKSLYMLCYTAAVYN